MQQLLSGLLGVLLLVAAAERAYNMSVPVPQFRTGTYADYQTFLIGSLAVYSGAAIGILVQLRRNSRQGHTMTGGSVFRAAFTGAMVAVLIALVLASVQAGGPGNLWGLLIILGGVYGAIISAGAGLIWYALSGPTRMSQT